MVYALSDHEYFHMTSIELQTQTLFCIIPRTYSLPAKNDDNRKRAIIAYVVSNRRQIIKLLVLLRWSRDSTQEVERCMNLVAFLQRQNFQLERAVESLKATRESLLTARVRNYDLVTAVDVFSAGTYTRLPNMFKVSTPLETSSIMSSLLICHHRTLSLLPRKCLQRRYCSFCKS